MQTENRQIHKLTVEDIQVAVYNYLKSLGVVKQGEEVNYNFHVGVEQSPSCYPSDSIDHHVFAGVTVTVSS